MLKCPDHDKLLKLVPAGVSKRTGRAYDAFYVCPTTGCKQTAPAANEPSYEEKQDTMVQVKKFEKEIEQSVEGEETKDENVPDEPMTRLDWNVKEFIKGLGVFSSAARSEGMDPVSAFESMHIWQWMDVAYGDMPGYLAWKAKAKQRIK